MTVPELEEIARGAAAGAVGAISDRANAEVEKQKAYRDRNLLALAFARARLPRAGYYYEDESAEYPVVWALLPSKGEGSSGQVSWHIEPELVDVVEEGLINQEPPGGFDGHSREEKNQRLANWVHPDGSPS